MIQSVSPKVSIVLRMKLFNASEIACETIGIIEKCLLLSRQSSYQLLLTIDILGYQPSCSDHVFNARQVSVIQ